MTQWFKGKKIEETDFSGGTFDSQGKFVPSGGSGGTAADISVSDAGGYFTGTDVEDVLQELGADVGSSSVILAPDLAERNKIIIPAPGTLGLIIKAHASQTADLQRWVSSTDAVLNAITAAGQQTNGPVPADWNVFAGRRQVWWDDAGYAEIVLGSTVEGGGPGYAGSAVYFRYSDAGEWNEFPFFIWTGEYVDTADDTTWRSTWIYYGADEERHTSVWMDAHGHVVVGGDPYGAVVPIGAFEVWKTTDGADAWGVREAGHEYLRGLTAIADADVRTSERAQWFDDTTGNPKSRFKMRDAAGTLTTGISASEGFVTTAVAAEATARDTAIGVETTARVADVDVEESARIAADAAEVTARNTAIGVETSARTAADATVVATTTHAATGKTTPVDADELPLVDSAASNVLKKLTWANVKATLKTYFDTLYAAVGAYAPGGTDVAVADGGTGASAAAAARTNLGIAAAVGGVEWTVVTKASDESVASSTAIQNDDELFFTAASGGFYEFDLMILYASPAGAGTPDIKWDIGEDATVRGSALRLTLFTDGTTAQGNPFTTGQAPQSGGTLATGLPMRVIGSHVGAGGTFRFRWAQNTSDVNPTIVRAGSILRYRRIV